MSRYIDADAFMHDAKWCGLETANQVLFALDHQPHIDIVRCSECKYASDNKVYGCMLNHFNFNDYDYHRMYADDFCSRGERKETQIETQNSNLTFEKDECAKEYEELGLKELKELINADRKTDPKDGYITGEDFLKIFDKEV